MGSSYSVTTMKNQSVINMLLAQAPPGKKATISNIAKHVTLNLQDSFKLGDQQSFMQQRAYQMESFLAKQKQATASKGVLDQTTVDASAEVVTETDPEAPPGSRLEQNLGQAKDIIRQLNLTSDAWAVESLARDLALFDLDFSALGGNPNEMADSIQERAKALVEELDKGYDPSNPAADYDARRREISGASARLVSSLRGAAGAVARASVSVETSANASPGRSVNIGGTTVDATAIVAAANVIVDPLVFDLNGDGLNLKGAEEGVDFDMDGDGVKTRTGFIRGDDALLFIDSNNDGVVTDGKQLFGNQDGHANGFEMLRSYDDNGDGVIDENDAVFDQLRLWAEKTEDGVCDTDETMSLREAGIKSINLGYENVREDDGTGNLVGQKGSFTKEDGSAGTAADVWFQELINRPFP